MSNEPRAAVNDFHELLAQLEDTLENSTHGWNNIKALEEANSLVQEISFCSETKTPVARQKLKSIRHWLPILYSERKHDRWGGSDQVLSIIQNDLVVLQDYVEPSLDKSA